MTQLALTIHDILLDGCEISMKYCPETTIEAEQISIRVYKNGVYQAYNLPVRQLVDSAWESDKLLSNILYLNHGKLLEYEEMFATSDEETVWLEDGVKTY